MGPTDMAERGLEIGTDPGRRPQRVDLLARSIGEQVGGLVYPVLLVGLNLVGPFLGTVDGFLHDLALRGSPATSCDAASRNTAAGRRDEERHEHRSERTVRESMHEPDGRRHLCREPTGWCPVPGA